MNRANLFDGRNPMRQGTLPANPPLIWPEPRILSGLAQYDDTPPARRLFLEADLVSALLVGVASEAVRWLEELLETEGKRAVSVVLVLVPAGPTRQAHLGAIHALQASHREGDRTLAIRILAMDNDFESDSRHSILPPTVIQAHNSQTRQTAMSIGSVHDAGCDQQFPGSVNFVFRPDDAMRDAWRRWFQYIFTTAAPLIPETCRIPHLVPAVGDPAAARQWAMFQAICQPQTTPTGTSAVVDASTGEVLADANGQAVVPWDGGKTAIDPLAQIFQRVYANGWLVTIDETTRIKPLNIPVKATLLGQQSERNVGAVKHRQSFSLQVLDEVPDRAIESCRKVTDLVELLTCPLSQGNRWLPETARELLKQELLRRNEDGKKTLTKALGGLSVDAFIETRSQAIRSDLNAMYRELGQGTVVPDDKFGSVLHEIASRLNDALRGRITPRVVYNRVAPPDLTVAAPDENWGQPLSLLRHCARILRESLTEPYLRRRMASLSCSMEDFRDALNPFGDIIGQKPDFTRAEQELARIEEIFGGKGTAKERTRGLWEIVTGIEAAKGR